MINLKDSFDQLLGITEVNNRNSNHEAELLLNLTQEHYNRYGYVHGGVFFSLCDACCGALVSKDENNNWVTMNASINYIANTKKGSLYAKAVCINKTRKTMVIDVKVTDSLGKILTVSLFTMYRISK